MEDTKQLSHPD